MKKKETPFSKYMAALHKQAAEPIYISNNTNEIEKEIHENCFHVSAPEALLHELDPLTLSIWLEVVRTNAKKQLTSAGNESGILFYCWYDVQAGQLRYNFINPDHKEPPFTSTLNYVNDCWAVCNAFLLGLQKQEYPANNQVVIFKQLLGRKTNYEFLSNEGWGPIKFGSSSAEVRKILNINYSNIVNSNSSTDHFDDSAFMVEYNNNDQVIAIQVTNNAQVVYKDLALLGQTANKVSKLVESNGYKLHPTKEGKYYKELGLYFGDKAKLKSLMMFAKGYYEAIEAIM